MSAPVTFDALALAPALAPTVGMLLVLTVDALAPRRRRPHLALTLLALTAGMISAAVPLVSSQRPTATLCTADGVCFWQPGPVATALQLGILASTAAAALLLADLGQRRADSIDLSLLLAAAAGGVAVTAAGDVGSWLVAIELATVPVIALMARRSTPAAAHGALTALMTSLVSFALLVLGAALWVTGTGVGSWSSDALAAAWDDPVRRAVVVLALVALVSGVGFKVSLVPFHAWTPVVWTRAPIPVTALLSAGSKLAALAALLMVLRPVADLTAAQSRPVHAALVALALTSMIVGALVALRAREALTLLAWSTISQGGWIVLALGAGGGEAPRAATAYALTYAVGSLVALAVVACVPGRALADYRGLLRTRPQVGWPLVLALLTFAGLPPAFLGLVTKLAVLRTVVAAGLWPVAVVAVVAVVVGIAAYARWLAVLVADPVPVDAASGESDRPTRGVGAGARIVVAVGTAALLVASLWPHLLFGLLD